MIEATIVGNVIKGYINGVEMITATDDTYATGAPGVGFNFGVVGHQRRPRVHALRGGDLRRLKKRRYAAPTAR